MEGHFRKEVERLRDSIEDVDSMLEHGLMQLLFMAVDPGLKSGIISTMESARRAIERSLKHESY